MAIHQSLSRQMGVYRSCNTLPPLLLLLFHRKTYNYPGSYLGQAPTPVHPCSSMPGTPALR
ncbi:hypothetical protein [Ktedonobacter sp. SOSP1-52]|uniref:hypothetical protein n=1 Tax=Ktedonobacter sp. SOSP1-52 TaxID=2778366 RepID=UPI001914EEC5|nr:hypothetical protein [Ktedonobacter sp. SOSP1-52]